MPVILIDVDGREHSLPGGLADDAALAAALGWTLKPEGLCRDETCVPLLGRSVADALGLLVVHDEEAGVAAVAPSAETHHREARRRQGAAADLTDVDGNPVSFDDFSGHKRVLVTWASWCGCRHELAGWQQLQDELADSGLKLFSVALDDDPEDSRPWIEAGHPSYPVAVDTAHVTAERYGITNVPSVVWVDEDDNIVKPPTIAPGDDQFVEFTKIASEQHHDALRRWVRDGELPESAQRRAAPAHRRRAAGARRAPGRGVPPAHRPHRRRQAAPRRRAGAGAVGLDGPPRRHRDDRRRPVPGRGVHLVLGGVGRLRASGLHTDDLSSHSVSRHGAPTATDDEHEQGDPLRGPPRPRRFRRARWTPSRTATGRAPRRCTGPG